MFSFKNTHMDFRHILCAATYSKWTYVDYSAEFKALHKQSRFSSVTHTFVGAKKKRL